MAIEKRNTKKTKLLFRHRSMEMGGVEKVLLSILNNLDRDRFEMTVLLNLNQGELRDEIPVHVHKVWLAEGREDMSLKPIIRNFQLLKRRLILKRHQANPRRIDRKLNMQKFDVEIAMDWRDFQAVLDSTNTHSKKIAWFHSEIDHPKFQSIVPQVLEQFPKFDQIVYCSEKIKALMHQHYPQLNYPEENVIINAIPIHDIKEKALEEITNFPAGPVFVAVGRLHTRKGFHKLMEAHAQLLKKGYRHSVIIVGDGEEMDHLKRQRSQLNVENSFILARNQMNPYAYMKRADFFIMPSESEAWPLVLAEALILQKPVIATDVGDVSQIISHLETGYLINFDTAEIFNAMKLFLTDNEVVRQIKNNLAKIETQFDNQKIFCNIEQMLFNLVKSENGISLQSNY